MYTGIVKDMGGDVYPGRGSGVKLLKEVEVELLELDQDGTRCSRHAHAQDAMVVVFHAKPRI
jgi:hypothetical protein